MILTFVTYTSELFAITSRWSRLISILLKRLCTSGWTFPYFGDLIYKTICQVLTAPHLAIVDVIVAWLCNMRLVLVMNVLISDTISTGVRRSLSLNYIICNISSSTSSTLSAMRLSQIKLLFLGKVYLV